MNTEQFLLFAECFSEPLLLVTAQAELSAANTAARSMLASATGDGVLEGRSLTALVEESTVGLLPYLRQCAASEQPQLGSLNCLHSAQQTLCHGRKLAAAGPTELILLRCTPSVPHDRDFSALSLRVETLQREIVHREQLMAELCAAQAHAQAVLDTAVEGIITIDKHGIVQSFNRAAEQIFGYRAKQIIGGNVNCLMPAPDRGRHDHYLQNYLRTGKKRIIGIGRRVKGLHSSGRVFPLALAVSEIRLGERHHFTGIVRDLSEQVKAEEEARLHRERLAHFDRISTMGEMATGIAHEINQPLAAISSYARACYRMIESGSNDTSELLQTLDKISSQAQRAGDIIHRLRTFVKKRKTQREHCELNELVRNSVALAETDAQEHHFTIEIALARGALPVAVDPIQIQQVILNLIRNAAEAMIGVAGPSDAVIVTVSTHLDEPGMAQVSITDKGHGINDDIADKLFDPFFTTKSTGTGIGLAISRTIITSHGGRLWFERNPDRGVTMHFTLPLTADTAETADTDNTTLA